MVRILTQPTLKEQTMTTLGSRLGADLLERGAVHPIRGADRRSPGYKGHQMPWRDYATTDFVALGFTAGELSGLTVWDFDSPDLTPPVTPNVRTRRGCHVYTPHQGERNLQRGIPGLDVLSNTNVVFWADNGEKEVVHSDPTPAEVMHDWWKANAGIDVVLSGQECIGTSRSSLSDEGAGERGTSTYAFGERSEYRRRAAERGYRLDLDLIARGQQHRVRHAPKGERNQILFGQAMQSVLCGMDPWHLFEDALRSDLPPDEVEWVLKKACERFDPTRVAIVLDRVDAWHEIVSPQVPRSYGMTLGELMRCAVQQNTMSPMVVQGEMAGGVNQSTQSRRLSHLDERGFIHKILMGWRGNHRRSNCYQLCLNESPDFFDPNCKCQLPAHVIAHCLEENKRYVVR